MKSFGIYYKKKEGLNPADGNSEVQMNVWKYNSEKNGLNYFIDFGLEFDCRIEEIVVYLPFKALKTDFSDLGSVISKNDDITSRLFNASIATNKTSQSMFTLVTVDDTRSFEICNLDIDNNNEPEYIKYGSEEHTLFYLPIPKKDANSQTVLPKTGGTPTATEKQTPKYYVRFRLNLHKHPPFSQTANVANDVVQSAFSKLELFDIRMNDKRHIPTTLTQIVEKNKGCELFTFKKIHYFYMVDVKESLQTSSPSCHDSRFLSKEDWSEYLMVNDIVEKNFISYHWKKIPGENEKILKSYQFCYSCIYPKWNIKQLFAYAGLVILLGFMGSMLSFSISGFIPGIPSWALWCKVVVVVGLIVGEIFYFWKYNNKS